MSTCPTSRHLPRPAPSSSAAHRRAQSDHRARAWRASQTGREEVGREAAAAAAKEQASSRSRPARLLGRPGDKTARTAPRDPLRAEKKSWTWLLTNVPPDFSAEAIGQLYRLRWQIELLFKDWKSYANLRALAVREPCHRRGLHLGVALRSLPQARRRLTSLSLPWIARSPRASSRWPDRNCCPWLPHGHEVASAPRSSATSSSSSPTTRFRLTLNGSAHTMRSASASRAAHRIRSVSGPSRPSARPRKGTTYEST